MKKSLLESSSSSIHDEISTPVLVAEIKMQTSETPSPEQEKYDYGDLDDYNEIFGEM